MNNNRKIQRSLPLQHAMVTNEYDRIVLHETVQRGANPARATN